MYIQRSEFARFLNVYKLQLKISPKSSSTVIPLLFRLQTAGSLKLLLNRGLTEHLLLCS